MLKISRIKITAAIISGTMLFMGMTACGKTQTSETLVNEAKQYQQKGDNKAAIIQLKNALQKNPDDVDARYLLGTSYNEIADFQSAEKELRKALSLGMSSAKVSPDLGKTLLMQGKFQMVLDEIKQISGEKESAEISSLRGNAYLALGKGKEAKESFEQALKIKPDFPDALIGLARHSITEKNIDAATHFSEQAVTKNPQNAYALLFKGDLLRAQGKIEPALAVYDQVLKLQPDNNLAHINKAYLEIGTGKFDAAKADIDAARKSSPNNLITLYAQALLDFRQGKHGAALESLQKVLSAAPEHMPSVLLAGAVQLALGSLPQAEQSRVVTNVG